MKAFPNEFESAGMDLRDYFAAKALQGILANPETGTDVTKIVIASWKMADAMMEARQK